jgi:hypothetical protein
VKGYLRERPDVAREIERKIYEIVGAEPADAPLAAVEVAAGAGTDPADPAATATGGNRGDPEPAPAPQPQERAA